MMNRMKWFQAAAATTLAGVALSLSPASAPDVSVGDDISYSFREPVLNGMGVSQLADLKGKPVLVEFWGTR
jgi:hypothetical protein